MGFGLPISLVSHVTVLALGLVSLNLSEPLEPAPIESINVDLISITEFSNIRAGSLESEVVQTTSPAIVDTEVPAELAERTGNTEEDQIVPLTSDNITPAPTEQTAPEIAPEPEPTPIPEPSPRPVEPEPEPTQVEAEPELTVEPVSEEPPNEVAPTPVIRTASIDRLRDEYAEQQRQEAAREADRQSAIVNAEETRGGTTGTGGEATLGRQDGQSATLTRSEQDALVAQMRRCWRLLPGEIESDISVQLLVELAQDGRVTATPQILTILGTSMERSIARAAQRAVIQCGPYALAPEKYAEWKQIDVTFRAGELL